MFLGIGGMALSAFALHRWLVKGDRGWMPIGVGVLLLAVLRYAMFS